MPLYIEATLILSTHLRHAFTCLSIIAVCLPMVGQAAAPVPGRIRVTSLSEPARGLSVEQLQTAAAADKDTIAAERASAEADRLRGQWKAASLLNAIKKYEEARSYWHDARNGVKEASALKNMGEVYCTLSEAHKALGCFEHALELSEVVADARLKIDVLNDLGLIVVDLGEPQKTLEYCNKALALSREINYHRGASQALNNIGLAYYDMSDVQKSLDIFNQALDSWRIANDTRGQAETLTNMGYAYDDLGEIARALFYYERALSLLEDVNEPRSKAQVLTAIGGVYSWQGEKQKALRFHNQAVQLFQMIGDRNGEAASLNGIGYVYDDMGGKQKALEFYTRALQLYRAAGNRHYEGITMGYVARMYFWLDDLPGALDFFEQKLALSRSLSNRRMEAYTLKDLGVIFDLLGSKQKALDYFNAALSLSQEVNDRRGMAYVISNIGYIHERAGDKQKALGFYDEALALIHAAEDRKGEAATLYNMARVERDLSQLDRAKEHIKTSLSIVESLRSKVISQELRTSYFASVRQHYQLYIDVLMSMHKQSPGAGYDVEAFEISERARARSLLELLIEARADIRRDVDAILLQREQALQQLLNAKAEHQVRLLNSKHTEEQAAAIKKEIADLTNQYEEVGTQIRASSPHYAALTQPQPLSLSEVQQKVLDPETLLLEYALGDETSYLWLVTQDSFTVFNLPGRAFIEEAARQVYDLLIANNQRKPGETLQQRQSRIAQAEAQFPEAAARLSRMLLEPVSSQLGTKRLVIVADGALQYIPFAALPAPDEAASSVKNAPPLIAAHEVVSLPSVSALAVLRKETAGRCPAAKAVALLADPVFEKDDVRVKRLKNRYRNNRSVLASSNDDLTLKQDLFRSSVEPESSDEELIFQRLPFAGLEAAAIIKLVPRRERKLALDFDASRETAMNPELGQYKIVHFATHGLLHTMHPELSGIVLSLIDERGKNRDGFLRLNEVYNLKLPVDMVVLSACQTALGKEIKGEGLIGLTRGFMYAGAARVVASLWKIDDRASAELMSYFYQGMFGPQRLRPTAALKAAQVAMWKQDRWKSPYYWAAFVLQGEWR